MSLRVLNKSPAIAEIFETVSMAIRVLPKQKTVAGTDASAKRSVATGTADPRVRFTYFQPPDCNGTA
jgi:hypothetical protein